MHFAAGGGMIVAGCLALLVGGCSLLTKLDGFSDAATSAQPQNDAGLDASVEAGQSQADAAAQPFCSTVPEPVFLCADFDGDPLPGSWEVHAASGGGVSLDSSSARSLPRSLLLSVPGAPPPGGPEVQAALARLLPAIPQELEIQFDTRADVLGAPRFDLFTIWKDDFDALGLEIDSEGRIFIDDDRRQPDDTTSQVTVDTGARLSPDWTRVLFVSTRRGEQIESRISVDGNLVYTHRSPTAPLSTGSRLFIGDWVVTPLSAPWRVHIDNVVVRVR